MKRFFLALLFLVACSSAAYAQESEISGGGSGGSGTVSVDGGSGTAGRIPYFTSATTLADSPAFREGANEVSLRNGATSQRWNVFNTYTSSTNNEGYSVKWTSNVAEIGTFKGSGGGSARSLDLQTDATTRVRIGASGNVDFGAGELLFGGAIGANDAGLARASAGVVEVTDGSTGFSHLLISGAGNGSSNDLQFGTAATGISLNSGAFNLSFGGSNTLWLKSNGLEVATDSTPYLGLGGSVDTILSREAAATFQLGFDAGTATAQTLKAADSTTAATAGANLTLAPGDGATTGASGSIFFQRAAASGSLANTWELQGTTGHFRPVTTATYDLGDSTHAVRSIYGGGGLTTGYLAWTSGTLSADNLVITVDASGGNKTVPLPAAASHTGRWYRIKKVDSSANTVTIDADAGELIDGATTRVLTTQYEAVDLVSDGSAWWIY